jgi:hypothetical protein
MMDALRLLDDADIARAYRFSPRELKYLLWHEDPKGIFTPTADTISTFLEELRTGLAGISATPTAIDVGGVVTKTYFERILGPGTTATTAYEIVAKTSVLSTSAQEAFIDANFGAFVNTTTAKSKLVTAGSSLLVELEARHGYIQPIIQIYVDLRARVIDRVASAFAIENASADPILRTYLHSRTNAGAVDTQSALDLLVGLGAEAGTLPAKYTFTYLLLQKVGTIVSRLKLATTDLPWVFNHGPLAIDALPVVTTSSATAFGDWSRLVRAAQLRDRSVDGQLFDVFEEAWVGTGSLSATLADIADRTGWSNTDLTYLAGNLSPALTYPNDFKDERGLVRLARAIDMCQRVGLPASVVHPWSNVDYASAASTAGAEATEVKTRIRGTFDASAWPGVVKPARDAIRERQRDAMVSYLVATNSSFDSAVDLSDSLLMDVEVGSCAKTSRIKQAISSTQTFIQRVFLNYEPTVALTTDDARQWQWMKAFRLWEANRKIFLWPENWIEPTLRDDKSELYERLETDLSKGELTDDVIEEALLAYLQGLEEIAHIEPVTCGTEFDEELNRSRFHVIGRTKAHPAAHYYRVRESGGRWVGWRKIEVDLQSDHVVMAIYNRRLHLYWAQFTTKPSQDKNKTPADKTYEVRVRGTSLRQGRWGKVVQAVLPLTNGRLLDLSNEDTGALGESLPMRTYTEPVTRDLLLRVIDDRFGNGIWLQRYRVTGSQGVPTWEEASSTTIGGRRRMPGGNSKSRANFYVSAPGASQLQLVDIFNNWSWKKPDQNVEWLTVLGAIPLPYQIVTSSPDDDSWVYDPFFYSDARHCFLIESSAIEDSLVTTTPAPISVPTPAPDSTNQTTKVWLHAGPLVSEKIDFAQTPPSGGGGSYSPVLISSAVPLTRPVTHTAFTFSTFSHPFVGEVLTQLNRLGIEGLYNPQPGRPGSELRRQAKVDDFFSVHAPSDKVTTPYPIDDFDFSPEGAYALYNWELFFHVPLLIATKLAAEQRFEESRRWFHFIFNPTEPSGPSSSETAPRRFWKVRPFHELSSAETIAEGPVQILKRLLSYDDKDKARIAERKRLEAQVEEWRENPFEPHRIARLRPVAYMKATIIKYLDMLLAWGDQLYARATLESINEALQIYLTAYRVLGKRPVRLPPQASAAATFETLGSLDAFSDALLKIEVALPPVNDNRSYAIQDGPIDQKSMVFCVPPNDKLLGYWDTVEDRLFKIRHCLNLQGVAVDLPLFEPPIDPGLLVKAKAAGIAVGSLLADVDAPLPLQRYAVLAQRASELASEVKALGQSFLSALEKKDAEELSLLRAGQEIQVMQAMRVSKAQSVVDATRAREALEQSRAAAVARRDYYASRPFTNAYEEEQLLAMRRANEHRQSSQIAQAIAGVLQAIPNFDVGVSGVGPHSTVMVGGTQFAALHSLEASVLNIFATWEESKAQLAGIKGGYQRRAEDWAFQSAQADIEIKNLDKQIVAAEIKEAIAQNDLDTQDMQIENSIAVRDFLRDKFTNVALYDWMVGELSKTYFQAYKLAYDAAKRAERAWKFEIYEDDPSKTTFITFGYWDGLRKGLLAGEKLALDLKRMEMAYLDKNTRELELVRHIPLTMLDPYALQELRETGKAEINLPESVFDADTPGHYFRRLKNVSVTIAGVTGPYTPVRCTLTLLSSEVRRKPNLVDARETSRVPLQSIVTSSGRDDSGLFETNLRDERYLPFEGAGAISRWRIELPRPNATSSVEPYALPLFDYRTISELVLHLRYTARDGGQAFREAVNGGSGSLADSGLVWNVGFSVKNVFSDEWFRFLNAGTTTADLHLALDRDHIPFRGAGAKIKSVTFVRLQKTISNTTISLTVSPSPGAAMSLAPDNALNKQSAGTATYGSVQNLGNWTVTGTVANFTADDDLFVIVTYVLPAAT